MLFLAGLFHVPAGAEPEGTARLRQALAAVCEAPDSGPKVMAALIPGAAPVAESPLSEREPGLGWERRYRFPGGAEVRIERLAPGGRLRQVFVEYETATAGGGLRPRVALVAGPDCEIRLGRRLLYDDAAGAPVAVEHLDRTLSPTGVREPLNPPVPAGTDPGGVPVALVDAGVNYLLPDINRRLARDGDGRILGFDFWDLDRRPFDANPARSPFFPERHGTRTAALLLSEAPDARLVPYRYPRPDMDRMADLVDDAATHGVRLVNMSLGSNDRGDWEAFAAAATRHPDMLFVLSAGNNGRDIDQQPVYPAALPLDNTITVTSSENDGRLAPGSNRGERAVDLLVPAERLTVTGFDGDPVTVSGSSYAAVRITALAARLLVTHPGWGTPQLKTAILARVLPDFDNGRSMVAGGFMPRPDKAEELPALSADGPVRETGRRVLEPGDLYREGREAGPPARHGVAFTLFYFRDTGWRIDGLEAHARQAASILAQCGIRVTRVEARELDGPVVYRYFHDAIGKALVDRVAARKPAVFFVRDTLQVDPYDAESIGRGNSATRPALRYTVWITEATPDPGIALAHELAHLLMDDGRHVDTPGNLMRARTAPGNTQLDTAQCQAMARTGRENGLLNDINE